MKNYKSVKISSRYTDFSFFGIVAMLLVMPIIFFYLFWGFEFSLKLVIILLVMLACFGFVFYCAMYMAKAKIVDNQFYLRKFLRPEKIYPISLLSDIKTYDFGKDHYIIFTINDNGISDKYLVYTTRDFLYSSEQLNSEQVLREILAENKK